MINNVELHYCRDDINLNLAQQVTCFFNKLMKNFVQDISNGAHFSQLIILWLVGIHFCDKRLTLCSDLGTDIT
jgi:hypothetical protein